MSQSKLLAKAAHVLDEPQNQRDARVEQLWSKLEPNPSGELDFKALKKGFRKIDHRAFCPSAISALWGC